ncbi:MAG: M28 family peptidase, partial [Pirellulaceae bacterium]|nr:M28 family peptidase [Pirellulaceae bacterium]
ITGVGWSDHWSFWEMGYQAFMVTDTAPFRYPHYHQPEDTVDKIDFQRLMWVQHGLFQMISKMAK